MSGNTYRATPYRMQPFPEPDRKYIAMCRIWACLSCFEFRYAIRPSSSTTNRAESFGRWSIEAHSCCCVFDCRSTRIGNNGKCLINDQLDRTPSSSNGTGCSTNRLHPIIRVHLPHLLPLIRSANQDSRFTAHLSLGYSIVVSFFVSFRLPRFSNCSG